MSDLRTQLRHCLTGRVCVVGVGNPDRGDDAFGPALAAALADRGVAPVIVAGSTPEHCLGRIERTDAATVLFLDATDFGAAPGAVGLFDRDEIAARHPQISTHHLSLGLLAGMLEQDGRRRVWLLGVQPAQLRWAAQLSAPVRRTADLLADLLTETLAPAAAPAETLEPLARL
jgi:hydrogenase maturation protease